MPYLEIISNEQSLGRRKLDGESGPLLVGRAPDCTVAVRDILLSRRHCQIEPQGKSWTVIDLNSKNGTLINGQKLSATHLLKDKDVVRIGRSKLVFRSGDPRHDEAYVPAPARAADPNDSLGGTLSGFTLLMPGESEVPENMACPQPRPKDPTALEREEIQSLLTAIASSSWDSIYAEARRPQQFNGKGKDDDSWKQPGARRMRARSPIDLSLQVSDKPEEKTEPDVAKKAARPPGFVRRLPYIVALLCVLTLRIATNVPAPSGAAMPTLQPAQTLAIPDAQSIQPAAQAAAAGLVELVW